MKRGKKEKAADTQGNKFSSANSYSKVNVNGTKPKRELSRIDKADDDEETWIVTEYSHYCVRVMYKYIRLFL